MFWLKAPPAGWKMLPGRWKIITMPEKLEEIQLQTRNVSLQSRVFPVFMPFLFNLTHFENKMYKIYAASRQLCCNLCYTMLCFYN